MEKLAKLLGKKAIFGSLTGVVSNWDVGLQVGVINRVYSPFIEERWSSHGMRIGTASSKPS